MGGALVVGAGDDAAVWTPGPGRSVVTTTDSLVEEVHFQTPADIEAASAIGWKLLAVSYSDLAAMGASPGPAFVSLSLPPAWRVEWVEAMYRDMYDAVTVLGGGLAGGNVSAASAAVLTSTCLGEVDPRHMLRRAGARPGWKLAVTGELGGAAAALRLAHADEAGGPAAGAEHADIWQQRLRRPQPRLRQAAAATAAGVGCGLDVSDGLFIDAGRLLGAGGAGGLVIESAAIPTDPGVRDTWPDGWLEVVGGGEDYELLLAAPPGVLAEAADRAADLRVPITVIGEFDNGAGVRVAVDGVERPPPGAGHQHFA